QLARLEAEKESLERWLQQNPTVMASAALRQQEMPGVYGPIADLFKTEQPYEKLLERALGDRADYFIADTLNDAQAAIRYLSDERKGWASFLVLGRVLSEQSALPFETPGSRSLADAVECEEKFRVVLRALLGQTYYVGATIFEEGLIRGGADPEFTDGLPKYQATSGDLNRLTQELE